MAKPKNRKERRQLANAAKKSHKEPEDEEMSPVEEESPEVDSLEDQEQEDVKNGSSKEDASEAGSEEDSEPTQDITTVALERTIFVGNLPNKLDHREVAKLFKSCGPVESARIRSVVPEKEKLSPKVALITKRLHPKVDAVNAYVVFAKTDDDECIKKALAMNGQVIDGHHIRVDRAQQPNSRRLTLTSRKKSVFVGNLRFDLRDDDLINHFQKAGSIDYVRLVRDRATGLGKGFGFVKFMERAAVKKALELNDTDFKGRKLRVKKIDEKTKIGDDDDKPKHKKFDRVKGVGGKTHDRTSNNNRDNKRAKRGGRDGGGLKKRVKFNFKNESNPKKR